MQKKFSYLEIGKSKYNTFLKKTVDFIVNVQLKDRVLWNKFVDVFGSNIDDTENGWRGEYWGKMMRGACLTYAYTQDEELYEILENAVFGLLQKQEIDGRISAYSRENEFNGWDMWARKYIMVGLEYFYRICKNEDKKEKILLALKAHADYIIAHIGEDKLPITQTSKVHGALNSCSILDSFLQLYLLTGEEKYKTFGKYVMDCGGSGAGDLVECVKKGLKPSEFPITKAYEMISFFEGILTYYEITGEEKYLQTVVEFCDLIERNEKSIVGGMGYRHEYFSDTKEKQTEFSTIPMLETCVTVTWIRVLSRLLCITGERRYADNIELSAYNALYGAINFELLEQYSNERKSKVSGLPFDSYSPLVTAHRGDRIGGYKELADGTHYGCCACIGAAAVALFPLGAVMTDCNGIVVNYYVDGEANAKLPSGKTVCLKIATQYPTDSKIFIKLEGEQIEELSLKLRIPAWCKNATVNGKTCSSENGYATVTVKTGDEILLDLPMEIKSEKLNGKTAFTRGPLVLARDEYKENGKIDFEKEEAVVSLEEVPCQEDEYFRCKAITDGGNEWILSDYKSCGKNWTSDLNLISVWLNVK